MLRYYYFIITAEAQRIKFRLLQYVEILKDDICAKQEIIDVLESLALYAKNIREHPQRNPVFNILLTQLTKLYFEITLMFDVLLSGEDYVSLPDFYTLYLNRQAGREEINEYDKALHMHKAQQIYNSDLANQALVLLSRLYTDLTRNPEDSTLIAIICALECRTIGKTDAWYLQEDR